MCRTCIACKIHDLSLGHIDTHNTSSRVLHTMHSTSHHQLNYRANLIIRGGWITKFSIQCYSIVSISTAIHMVALALSAFAHSATTLLSRPPGASPKKATFEFMQVSESEIRFITVILKLLSPIVAWLDLIPVAQNEHARSALFFVYIPPTTPFARSGSPAPVLFAFECPFISNVVRFAGARGVSEVCIGWTAFYRKMQTATLW